MILKDGRDFVDEGETKFISEGAYRKRHKSAKGNSQWADLDSSYGYVRK